MDRLNQIRILEKEINFHAKEIITHKHLAEIRISKTQKLKATKHFHKKFQTIKIANLLNFYYCEHCRSLR